MLLPLSTVRCTAAIDATAPLPENRYLPAHGHSGGSTGRLRCLLKCKYYLCFPLNPVLIESPSLRHHVNLSRPVVHLMNTGAHTMEEISCSTCHSYLGWHIIRAHSSSERWKEGHFLMELENLSVKMDKPRRQRSVMSSDSEDSNLE